MLLLRDRVLLLLLLLLLLQCRIIRRLPLLLGLAFSCSSRLVKYSFMSVHYSSSLGLQLSSGLLPYVFLSHCMPDFLPRPSFVFVVLLLMYVSSS